jgi:UDP-N-acetylmuramate: L-alanyl-gamma-D-glutamyl-meso-diaminopimelate ligase
MESPRHVHFVAICGTGMGSLAGLLKARGVRVTGSDDALYPPMSTSLESWGIPVQQGFRAEHVLEDPPDLVVIGNAVRPDNPEACAAIDESLAYLSFPDALHQLAIAGRHSVVVAGTHGKTTTTSLVASLLRRTGRDPSLLVGGYAFDFDGSFCEGGGDHFVVEGDEYDTAYFDKTPKFLHYGARTAVVTSVEFDHADIYRDLDHVKQAFRKLVSQLPPDGALVAAANHPSVRDVLREAPCRIVGYGLSQEGEPTWRAVGLEADREGTPFELRSPETDPPRAWIPLHGRFNVENALAALATVATLGVPVGEAVAALARFGGVKRRQEVRGEAGGVLVIDDFAHHPTAVRGSLEALRARFPERRLVAVFEPRTNTSRRAVFQDAYASAFADADRVVISAAPAGPLYSATGEVTEFFSPERLVADLRAQDIDAVSLPGPDAVVAHLATQSRPGDVVLTMSNGAFGNLWGRLLEELG